MVIGFSGIRILSERPDCLDGAVSVFPELVGIDQAEFGNQHEELVTDPAGTLKRALARARDDSDVRQGYRDRLQPLVYAGAVPAYATAFAVFENAAVRLIDTLTNKTRAEGGSSSNSEEPGAPPADPD